MIVDIHIHLDDEKYNSDRDEVIKRAKDAKVVKIITAGLNKETNRASLALAQKYDIVQAMLGIYPEDAEKLTDEEVNKELQFISDNKDAIYGIGECGLDLFHGTHDGLEKQKTTLIKQIKLAKKLKKPILIHSRKAEQETIDLLRKNKAQRVIMHCFSGKKSLIKEGIELEYSFSIPTNCTRAQNFQQLIEMVPLRQLLTETDGPYLSPYKNEDATFNRNEPAYITETIKIISQIKGITTEDCIHQLYMNFQRL